jgi:hypothetical protein
MVQKMAERGSPVSIGSCIASGMTGDNLHFSGMPCGISIDIDASSAVSAARTAQKT